jgi:hypothetical protein
MGIPIPVVPPGGGILNITTTAGLLNDNRSDSQVL